MIDRSLLPSLATQSRKTRVEVGVGRWREEPVVVRHRVPCRRVPASARDREIGFAMQVVCTHSLYFLPTADVQVGDVLEIDGARYEAKAPLPPSEPVYVKFLAEQIVTTP